MLSLTIKLVKSTITLGDPFMSNVEKIMTAAKRKYWQRAGRHAKTRA